MKRALGTLLAIVALAAATNAAAHTAWLERDARPGVWRLMYGGHQGMAEPATPGKLKAVTAVDALGRPLRITRTVDGSDVRVAVAGQPAMLALYYDNGIHTRTRTPGPSIERPMNEVDGGVSATSAQKYGKTVVAWAPIVTRPIGQALEVIPTTSVQPRAGQPMRVQVLIDGRPVAGVRVGRGEETASATTDADGMATFTPTPGANKLWAGRRIATRDNPRYTQLSYEYLLTFDAR